MSGVCGICGLVSTASSIDRELLREMASTVVHRGPDDEGYYVADHVGLANRRLSIIDLPGGHQPIHSEDERFWITFNGEIFNYRDLRPATEAAGHTYYTNSDTEVLLHMFEEEGPAMLDRLNGMWAFAIWDAVSKELFLARDRLGVKPLYYVQADGSLAFGSEIKALLPALESPPVVDVEAIPSYLAFRTHYGDRTLFRGIRQLRPGHWLRWQDGNLEVQSWWDILGSPSPMNPSDGSRRLRTLLEDSVRLRLIADVPVGVFLSGGIDSSAVAGLMATVGTEQVRTFSVGFDDASHNELEYARAVADKFATDHHEITFTPHDLIQNLARMTWHFDEPLIHSTGIAQSLISDVARKSVKVVLCGHGGDELFAGYEILHDLRGRSRDPRSLARWFIENYASRAINLLPLEMRDRSRLLHLLAPSDVSYIIETSAIKEGVRARLLTPSTHASLDGIRADQEVLDQFARAPAADPLNRVLYVMQKTYLVGLLTTQDKMSMAASIESRVPLLDYRVVEFAAAVPPDLKIHDGRKKYLLLQAVRDLLPEKVLHHRKMGFSAPERDWFRGELGETAADFLTGHDSAVAKYFSRDYITQKLAQHAAVDNSYFLWSLFAFELWHRVFIEHGGDWTKVRL